MNINYLEPAAADAAAAVEPLLAKILGAVAVMPVVVAVEADFIA